jgi:hypothetical protein
MPLFSSKAESARWKGGEETLTRGREGGTYVDDASRSMGKRRSGVLGVEDTKPDLTA